MLSCRLYCPGYPVPEVLLRLSFCDCPVPAVLPKLSVLDCPVPGCSVQVVLSRLSCLGRQVRALKEARLSFPNLPVPVKLLCSGCPVSCSCCLSSLFWVVLLVLWWLAVLTLLSGLSWPDRPVVECPERPRHGCIVLAVLTLLSCPRRPGLSCYGCAGWLPCLAVCASYHGCPDITVLSSPSWPVLLWLC